MPLNNLKELFNQQCGFSMWRNSDTAIKRLRCRNKDFYTNLAPPLGIEFYRETPIFSCKFSPQEGNEHLIALANEDGKIAVHNCNNDERYSTHAHNNAIFDLAWMLNQMKIVTASGDHTSKLYSVENGEFREERVFSGHVRSVKTVTFRKDDTNVFASGGRDGNIVLWDVRSNISNFVGKIDGMICKSHSVQTTTPSKSRKKFGTFLSTAKSVTGLVFQDGNTLISCGAGDGIIKVWDLRKNYATYKRDAAPKNLITYPGNTTRNGYSNLVLDNDSLKLYANCLDNTIYCFNVGTYNNEPVMKYTGHHNNTFYVKSSLCKNGNYLLSGSSDENAYIWNIKHSEPLVRLTGHTAEVTSVAWSNRDIMLITCSDDMSHKIWRVGSEELPENWEFLGRGVAEVIPTLQTDLVKVKLKRSMCSTSEEYTPKKMCVECQRCNNMSSTHLCENCNVTSSKRKNSCELTNENKRLQTELGPRRLFANVNNVIIEEPESLAQSLDHNEQKVSQEEWEPPNKIPKLLSSPCSSKSEMILSSPTVNLPNYVVDGVAPHMNYSPPKKKDRDWLTKLRTEKNLRREMCERTTGPSSPKVPKLEIPSPTARCLSPKNPLLRFFKVTNSSPKCDGINCSKSHGCSNIVSNILPHHE